MNRFSLLLLSVLALSACDSSPKPRSGSTPQTPPSSSPKEAVIETPKRVVRPRNEAPASYIVKVTAFNYLDATGDTCEVTDLVLTLSDSDQSRLIPICKNSAVELYAVSDAGTLKFTTLDVAQGKSLLPLGNEGQTPGLLLSERGNATQYEAINPYGYTFATAKNFTGTDNLQLVHLWTKQYPRLTAIKGQIQAKVDEEKRIADQKAADKRRVKAAYLSIADKVADGYHSLAKKVEYNEWRIAKQKAADKKRVSAAYLSMANKFANGYRSLEEKVAANEKRIADQKAADKKRVNAAYLSMANKFANGYRSLEEKVAANEKRIAEENRIAEEKRAAEERAAAIASDVKPPYLETPLKDALVITSEIDEKDSNYVFVTATLSGLRDDISGIGKISFMLRASEQGLSNRTVDDSALYLNFSDKDLANQESGSYHHTDRIQRNKLFESTYRASFYSFSDLAGNQHYASIEEQDAALADLHGSKLRQNERPPFHNIQAHAILNRITIAEEQIAGISELAYHVEIPTTHPQDLNVLYINAELKKGNKTINFQVKDSMFESRPGDPSIITHLVFPKHFQNDTVTLATLDLHLNETATKNSAAYSADLSDMPGLSFDIHPSEPDLTFPEVDTKAIGMRQVKGTDLPAEFRKSRYDNNPLDEWIEFTFPVSGVEEELNHHLEIDVWFLDSNNSKKIAMAKPNPSLEDGKKIYRVYEKIPVHHKPGKYQLSSVNLTEMAYLVADGNAEKAIKNDLKDLPGIAQPRFGHVYYNYKEVVVDLLKLGIATEVK